jgi:hypothetical protein
MSRARIVTIGVVLAAAIAGVVPRPARANIVTLNPGVKIGYTIGRGWTYGLEISVAWMEPEIDWVIGSGAVLDFTWTKDLFELRAGYEMFGPGYGLEVGPALVVGPHRKTSLAIDVTPWLGAVFADPYLTMSFGVGGPSRTEVGTYLKLPLCLHDDDGCYSGGSGGHDWD